MKDKRCLCGKAVTEETRQIGQEPIYCSIACARRDAYSALTARETLKKYGIIVQEPESPASTAEEEIDIPDSQMHKLQNIFAHVSHYRRCCKEEKFAKRLMKAEAKAKAKASKARCEDTTEKQDECDNTSRTKDPVRGHSPPMSQHMRNDSDASTMTSASTASTSSVATPNPSSPGYTSRMPRCADCTDYFGFQKESMAPTSISTSAQCLSQEHLYWANAATESKEAYSVRQSDIGTRYSRTSPIGLDRALTQHLSKQFEQSSLRSSPSRSHAEQYSEL